MTYNPEIHHRRSIRLKGYDYSQNGAYFITICTQNRECLFGNVVDGKMILNDAGQMVENEWKNLPERFQNIELDVLVVMPNHIHGILIIQNVGASFMGAQNATCKSNVTCTSNIPCVSGQPQGMAPTVGDIVGAFKSMTTNEYIHGVKSKKFPPFEKRIWQRNYHEHIIRNEKSFEKIHNYIICNPESWEDDTFFDG